MFLCSESSSRSGHKKKKICLLAVQLLTWQPLHLKLPLHAYRLAQPCHYKKLSWQKYLVGCERFYIVTAVQLIVLVAAIVLFFLCTSQIIEFMHLDLVLYHFKIMVFSFSHHVYVLYFVLLWVWCQEEWQCKMVVISMMAPLC